MSSSRARSSGAIVPEPPQVDRETNLAFEPAQPVVRRPGSHQFEPLADGRREVLAARALRSVDEVGRELDRHLAGRGHMALSNSCLAVANTALGSSLETPPATQTASLLVRDCCARRADERHDRAAAEARLGAPAVEVRTGEVERVAELDQHVERDEQAEEVLTPLVVDEGLHGDERATRRQRLVRG